LCNQKYRKFANTDNAYFKRRKEFANRYNDTAFWQIADNWPLYSGEVNIARFLAIYELVKKVVSLPGHFCELGCYNGTNLIFIAKLLKIFRPGTLTEVIGFDSFEGLQTFSGDKDSDKLSGEYKGNLKILEDIITLHQLENWVQLVKGDILKTLPAFLEERKDIRFSMVYIDVDLYSPAKIGVELLYPKLLKGGIMVFDEYNTRQWPGETRALHDVFGEDVILHSIPYTRQPTAYIVK